MLTRLAYLFLAFALTVPLALADDSSSASSITQAVALPNLLGLWSGSFRMLTPQGFSSGHTEYEFTEQNGNLLKGINRWRTLKTSEGDGNGDPLPQGVNEVLGVIADDGFVYVVSNNDTATRRMQLVDENTLDFAEYAGGDERHVVSGRLSRD